MLAANVMPVLPAFKGERVNHFPHRQDVHAQFAEEVTARVNSPPPDVSLG